MMETNEIKEMYELHDIQYEKHREFKKLHAKQEAAQEAVLSSIRKALGTIGDVSNPRFDLYQEELTITIQLPRG